MDAIYRFVFNQGIPSKEIKENLFWAVVNVESIHGKPKVQLDASFEFDPVTKVCVIDKSTEVGQNIAQVFTSLITRAFGEESFKVERIRKKKKFSASQQITQTKKSV